jgi:hypothetical protein
MTRYLLPAAMAVGLAFPACASAQHCGRVYVQTRGASAKVRVVRGPISCKRARSLIKAAYHAEDTRHSDGYNKTFGMFWRVQGWRCYTGLAWSQAFCFRDQREADGSTRRDDGWSF